MPFLSFDREQRRLNTLEKLSSETNITRATQSGVARSVMEAVLAEVDAIEDRQEDGNNQSLPTTASGPYLEMWGDFLGTQAGEAKRAHALATDQVFKFYVASGTFGDINDGSDISISASDFQIFGTTQHVDEGEIIDLPIEYRLLDDIVLPAGSSEVWATIVAVQLGDEYSVGANQLNSHNFTGYASYGDKELLVNNVMPIVNGDTPLDDNAYRFKISRANAFRPNGIIETLVQGVDNIAGVSDVFYQEGVSGSGTVDIFIDAESFVIPDSLITTAQSFISSFQHRGAKVNVYKVERLGISIDSVVKFKTGVTEEQKDDLIRSLEIIALDALVGSQAGAVLDLNVLFRRLEIASPLISSIGDGEFFDDVTLYREGLSGQRYGQQISSETYEVTPKSFERILPEDGLIKPVSFRKI